MFKRNRSEGERLRDMAKQMATAPLGTDALFRMDNGVNLNVAKDPDGGEANGLSYAMDALAARIARGDNDTEDEIQILIKRARSQATRLQIEDPEEFVRSNLKRTEDSIKSRDGSL